MRRRQLLGAATLGTLAVGVGYGAISRPPGPIKERSFTTNGRDANRNKLAAIAEKFNFSVPSNADKAELFTIAPEAAHEGPYVVFDDDTGTVEALGFNAFNPECEYVALRNVTYDEEEDTLRVTVGAADELLSCIFGGPEPISFTWYRVEVRFAERWVADHGLPTRVVATDDGGTTSAPGG